MKEYIVSVFVGDDDIDYGEVFIAYVIRQKELIRCKDCKNYGTGGNRLNCNVFCCSMPENGFCSMGERKEDETD